MRSDLFALTTNWISRAKSKKSRKGRIMSFVLFQSPKYCLLLAFGKGS